MEIPVNLKRMSSSRVVVVRSPGILSPTGELETRKLDILIQRGLALLFPDSKTQDSLRSLFSRSDTVGIKVNTIGGRKISTRPELALSLSRFFSGADIPQERQIIWDRTNRELKEAGFSLRQNRRGVKVYGTDTQGVGYSSKLVGHRSIGSLFSCIQESTITASVSLAILKDHGLAGITGGMKNYFGAIHNPNKYHDNHCDPFVAEVFDADPIKGKHRLSVLDALRVQFHMGPAYHARWAEHPGVLIFSRDPVAADMLGWQLIEELRAKAGLPSLVEEGREPVYIRTAARLGLGKALPQEIHVIEEVV